MLFSCCMLFVCVGKADLKFSRPILDFKGDPRIGFGMWNFNSGSAVESQERSIEHAVVSDWGREFESRDLHFFQLHYI